MIWLPGKRAELPDELEAIDLDHKSCPAEGQVFLCTRKLGHHGDHVAAGKEGLIFERWADVRA